MDSIPSHQERSPERSPKRRRGEASPLRDRLSSDHAVRNIQLQERQRLQGQQSNADQHNQEKGLQIEGVPSTPRDLALVDRLLALAESKSLSKDEFIERYINELQIKDQEFDDTENALDICSRDKNLNSIIRENYKNMLKYTQDYRAGSSQPDVASDKRPLSEGERKYTLIDIANDALKWRNSGYNKPLDPNILKFVESQNPNFYELDRFYEPIRVYYKNEHKMDNKQIEDVMLRVYEYYKTVKAKIRRKEGP